MPIRIGVSPRAALTVDGQVARGLKVDRYRLVHKGPGRMELYDELADPREQKDVAADHPIALRGMRGVLGLLYAYETTWSKARWGTAANVTEAFYTSAGPPGPAPPASLCSSIASPSTATALTSTLTPGAPPRHHPEPG